MLDTLAESPTESDLDAIGRASQPGDLRVPRNADASDYLDDRPSDVDQLTLAARREIACTLAGSAEPFDWEARCVALTWQLSRASGVALIVHPTVCVDDMRGGDAVVPVPPRSGMDAVGWQRFKVEGQRRENDRRDRATPFACSAALMGYIEGRYSLARALGEALGGDRHHFFLGALAGDASHPTYTELRNFLIGELDAHPVVAAAAAFYHVSVHDRHNLIHKVDASDGWSGDGPGSGSKLWL